jgi:hypothetical protein
MVGRRQGERWFLRHFSPLFGVRKGKKKGRRHDGGGKPRSVSYDPRGIEVD